MIVEMIIRRDDGIPVHSLQLRATDTYEVAIGAVDNGLCLVSFRYEPSVVPVITDPFDLPEPDHIV